MRCVDALNDRPNTTLRCLAKLDEPGVCYLWCEYCYCDYYPSVGVWAVLFLSVVVLPVVCRCCFCECPILESLQTFDLTFSSRKYSA